MYGRQVVSRFACLFQPRYPSVQHPHELGFESAVQFAADAVRHVEVSLLAVLVGDDQVEGLHHQFLAFLPRPGEAFIGLHGQESGNDLLFLGGQGIVKLDGIGEEIGMDDHRIVCLAVVGRYSAAECGKVLLQVGHGVQRGYFLHGFEGINEGEFLEVYHRM